VVKEDEIFQGEERVIRKRRRLGGAEEKIIAGGVLLTYDTTLQVVSGTAQKDLFLDGSLLWRHLGFLFLAGGEAAEVKREER
jgi:hypothetical protein